MKRIQEKVKDLIEVRPYKILQDFIAEAAQTLGVYHFTDVTSELMAKWLDKISSIQFQNGAAFALADYRGVGKSHFLATIGAIVSHAELRSHIIDQPFCACSFNLSKIRNWEKLPLTLQEIIDDGRESYRNTLSSLAETLVPLIEQFSAKNTDNKFAEASFHLIKILEGSGDVQFLDNNQLIILRKVFESERGINSRPLSANKAIFVAAEYMT